MSDVNADEQLRLILKRELVEYVARTPMTKEEYERLCQWVADGNSPYGNPHLMTDESGVELDFIQGIRIAEELANEHRRQ